jgi:hypothetical protein
LQVSDSAVLVRSMAQELIRSCEEVDNISIHSGSGVGAAGVGGTAGGVSGGGGKRRLNGAGAFRRTSSSTTPPHLLERQMSMPIGPSSPQIGRSERSSIGFFDGSDGVGVGPAGRAAQTPRRGRNGLGYLSGSTAIRPESRDGTDGLGKENSTGAKFPIAPLQRASTTVGAVNSPSLNGGSMSEMAVARSRLPRGMSAGPPRMSRQSTAHVNGSRDSGGKMASATSAASSAGTPSDSSRNSREHLAGPKNGGGGVDITIASTRRTTARRRLSGDGKWS